MKKVLLFITILLSSIMFMPKMLAASMNVSASATTLNVSDSVTISVSLNNIEGKFRISSSDTSVLDGGLQTNWVESGYITATFTAKRSGSATITVTPITATTMDPENEQDYTASKSVTIRVVEPSRGNSGGGSSNNNSITKKNKQSYDYGDDSIDINNVSIEDLRRSGLLDNYKIEQIIKFRKEGYIFKSLDDLAQKLHLTNSEIDKLRRYIKINQKISNSRKLDI